MFFHISGIGAETTLTIAATQSLAFGSLIPLAATGSITLSAQGSVSAGNAVYVRGSSRHVALFSVTGEAGRAFVIALPSSATLVGSGSATIIVDTFTVSPSSPASIGADGTCGLFVGATLRVGADQATGDYSGTFELLVSYE
ncbi:MAG TPA: DUF4402 domain-containing protein [Rectinemataceae bacterium]|nr:DUF4402 domain-containing protein [Rectinemataceae bacterium]